MIAGVRMAATVVVMADATRAVLEMPDATPDVLATQPVLATPDAVVIGDVTPDAAMIVAATATATAPTTTAPASSTMSAAAVRRPAKATG